jgi:hypothetical protein
VLSGLPSPTCSAVLNGLLAIASDASVASVAPVARCVGVQIFRMFMGHDSDVLHAKIIEDVGC